MAVDRKYLESLVRDTFKLDDLVRLVRFALNTNLAEVTSPRGRYDLIVFELFEWCEHRGRLDDFLRAAVLECPQHPKWKDVGSGLIAKSRAGRWRPWWARIPTCISKVGHC